MKRHLEIRKLEPFVDGEGIFCRLDAMLIEEDDTGTKFRIPKIIFQVKSEASQTVEKIADDTGMAIFPKIPLSAYREVAKIQISAKAEPMDIIVTINLSIGHLLEEVAGNKRKAETETKTKTEAETTERKQAILEAIFCAKKDLGKFTTGEEAWKVLVKYEDHPKAREAALEAARAEAYQALRYFHSYKDAKWAKEVIFTAIMDRGLDISDSQIRIAFQSSIKSPWGKELVMKIAQKKPELAMRHIEQYLYYPWCKDVAMAIAESHPETLLEYKRLIMHEEWHQEVIECAKKNTRKL